MAGPSDIPPGQKRVWPDKPNIVLYPDWPWPFIKLSDGTILAMKGWFFARSLIHASYAYGRYANKPITIRPGDQVMVRHDSPGSLTLGKPSRGNRLMNEMKSEAEEGIDFELIDGKPQIGFNETIEQLRAEHAATRAKYEAGGLGAVLPWLF